MRERATLSCGAPTGAALIGWWVRHSRYVCGMHVAVDDLVAALRTEGLRITKPRRAVCAVLAASHGEHLSAPAIHERTSSETGVAVDQSTVYRTLETLEAAGLITHTHLPAGASVYHLADEAPHQHLVCVGCGRTLALPESEIERFVAEIKAKTGFVLDPTHVALSGHCAECAAATLRS